jgi:retinol-binding protein 3
MRRSALAKTQCLSAAFVLLISAAGWAQPSPAALPVPGKPLSTVDKRELIAVTVREMNDRYVFPDVAKRAGDALQAKFGSGAYDAISDGHALAKALTDDLLALTKDTHIRYQYSAAPMPARALKHEPTDDEIAAEKLEAQRRNFGVERVERLPGNIGYIELTLFHPALWAGDAISAALTLVAHTDALIIDVRRNGGGDPETVALVTSYLLEERTHLNSFYYRDGNRTQQFWSRDWVPGPRFGGKKPVYVLSSKRSASGAEEFAYNLKHLKRATLVGETTVGGANPGDFVQLTPHFLLFIPNGRAINPITQTNWEGVGVVPDTKVAADDALRISQLMALKSLVQGEKDPRRARALADRMAALERAASKG